MTVLEQLLLGAVYVLLVVVGLQRTDIRETRRLLRQVQARREHLDSDISWITAQARRIQQMTDEVRRTREIYLTKEN